MSGLRDVLTEALREAHYRIVGGSSDVRVDPGQVLADALLTLPGVVVTQLPKPPADCHVCHYQAGTTPEFYVLCPECGCKRCPKATNHVHACTGSNDLGQRGSSYGEPCGEACCAEYDAYVAARAEEMRAELDQVRAERAAAAVLAEGEDNHA